jgi:hypothetical protein
MERELTTDLMNEALIPESRKRGYCLCVHHFMTMIDFAGLECKYCGQRVTDDSYAPAAKAVRTEVVIAAYPWAARS